MQREWRCTRCKKLLGLLRDGRVHLKFARGHVQLGAVKAALNQTAATLIEQELRTSVDSCMEGDAGERMRRVTKALATVFKAS
jgi:hypothetical protein